MKSQGALSPAGKLRLATKTAMVAGMTALQPVQALSAIWAMTTAVIVAMTSSPWMRALRKGWKRPEVWAEKELGQTGYIIYCQTCQKRSVQFILTIITKSRMI
jgi:ABC-type sugar transport system substrate-binding protein